MAIVETRSLNVPRFFLPLISVDADAAGSPAYVVLSYRRRARVLLRPPETPWACPGCLSKGGVECTERCSMLPRPTSGLGNVIVVLLFIVSWSRRKPIPTAR